MASDIMDKMEKPGLLFEGDLVDTGDADLNWWLSMAT